MSKSALLTVRELAQILDVHPSTVRRHCASGEIPAQQVVGRRGGRGGQVYMIPRSSLRVEGASSPTGTSGSSPIISIGTFRAKGGREAVLRAADRLDIIQAARSIAGPNRTEKLRTLARAHGIGLSTLYRWMDHSGALSGQPKPTLEGAAKTLRSKFDERGMRRRISIEPEARDFFLAAWNAQNKPPVTAIIEHIYKPKAKEMGWKVPSRATFYRLVSQDLSAIERKAGRDGISALRKETLPKNTVATPDVRNRYWIADHRQLDQFVQHPQTGKPVRPWLSAFIDGSSRALLGWKLALTPTSDSIITALHNSVFAPAPFVPSLPEYVLTDNGQDFRSNLVKGTLEALNIKHHTAEVYAAWQKQIESFFKLLSYRFDRFGAWSGHNVMTRPELLDEQKLAAEGKLPTFAELEACLGEFFLWYNTEHQHTGDGMDGKTPAARYAELPPARVGIPSAKAWSLLTMREERRRVSDQGIKMFGKIFFAPELYLGNRLNRSMADEWVAVRFDPHDQTRLFVFYEGEYVCQVYDKPRPTWDPADEENMAIAGRVRNLNKRLEKDTMERLQERQASSGYHNPWVPKPESKQPAPADQAAEPGRMITRMDRAVRQIEEQQKAATAPKRRNDAVSAKIQSNRIS
ncbi:MAG: helix-turn-helix domain-containing protein [Bacillota bacterium]